MKKLLNISLLLFVALSMGLASCNHEEKDLFDDSAAQRLTQTQEYFYDLLLSEGGKWQLEYFTTPDEPGYIYLFTFKKDGTVTISGENEYIGKLTNIDNSDPVYGSETSMWEVISDNGPVLSLNTYNKIFHLFADPYDIPDTDGSELGYGHTGDYEFDLMRYSNDTLYIEGKKHGVSMIMTRLATDVDDHAYLDEVVALRDSFFNSKIPTVYINLPSGYRYVVNGGASLMLAIYPETGDWISETEGYNAVVTHDGLTFMYPLQLMDSLTMTPYEVRTFKLAPDGSLVCRENPEITFTADALNSLITDPQVKWKLNTNKSSAVGLMEKYNELADQLKAANRNNGINAINMNYDNTQNKFVVNISIKIRINGRSTTMPCLFYLDVDRENKDLIKFTFNNEMDAAATRYIQSYSKLLDIVNYIASNQFKLSATSLLAPVSLNVAESANENNYFVLDVVR